METTLTVLPESLQQHMLQADTAHHFHCAADLKAKTQESKWLAWAHTNSSTGVRNQVTLMPSFLTFSQLVSGTV